MIRYKVASCKVYVGAALLLAFPALPHAAEITGAFGITLGQTFDPAAAISQGKTQGGDILYGFRPKNPYPAFARYYVLITPRANRVYSIWAIGEFDSSDGCESEADKIVRILKRRYPDANVYTPPWYLQMPDIKFRRGKRRIAVRCVINVSGRQTQYDLYIQYTDSAIEKEVERQKKAEKRAKQDAVKAAKERAKREAVKEAEERGETKGF